MKKNLSLIISLIIAVSSACVALRKKHDYEFSRPVPNVKFAGARSSHYGIKPFPTPENWQQAMTLINNQFYHSTPCAIWIVGTIDPKGKRSCRLEFPSAGNSAINVAFSAHDKHEPFLNYFDQKGIQVFLQVEPAHADVTALINLVLNRYKHHPSVIGFGVDVEWYREADRPGWGVKVDDQTARIWEEAVKKHNAHYRLFLKHWDRKWMPPRYRGDIIFVSDSQMLDDLDTMVSEFVDYWANYFKPNTVFFQIGYPRDRHWWRKLANPVRNIGGAIAQNLSQHCGIFWVDFTLKEVVNIQ